MAASERSHLVLREGQQGMLALRASAALAKHFGRSLKMRQVSAGGCNACELELNALGNVNFDVQRFGIEWVASPRHADALVVTGPLTRTMRDAIRLCWDAMPDPRFVVAVGACAISGGLYDGAAGVDRTFFESVGPSLFVPGCPPHPLNNGEPRVRGAGQGSVTYSTICAHCAAWWQLFLLLIFSESRRASWARAPHSWRRQSGDTIPPTYIVHKRACAPCTRAGHDESIGG